MSNNQLNLKLKTDLQSNKINNNKLDNLSLNQQNLDKKNVLTNQKNLHQYNNFKQKTSKFNNSKSILLPKLNQKVLQTSIDEVDVNINYYKNNENVDSNNKLEMVNTESNQELFFFSFILFLII